MLILRVIQPYAMALKVRTALFPLIVNSGLATKSDFT